MDYSLIGLTIRDKRIYEALVRFPESSVRKLAEETHINRGSVFESLSDLLAAGLVTRVLYGKRVMYRAKDPEILREIIEEKRQELALAKSSVGAYIQSFAGQANDPSLFHFTSLYKGDEGLAAILRDVLKTCRMSGVSEYRSISSPRVSRYLYNNFPYFSRERVKQGIFVRVLRQGLSGFEFGILAEDFIA
jgi:sugar-specific transcriptional regulator TrmB